MQIAQTILAQLGGNRFIAMTGAKNLVDIGNGLQFKLPANFAKSGINLVSVKLEPSDTYTVDFFKFRGLNLTPIESASHVFADELRGLFTATTGLDTSL